MAMIACLYTYAAIIHVPTLTGKAIPDPRGIAAEGHDPQRYHWRRQFQWQILDIKNPFIPWSVYPSGRK